MVAEEPEQVAPVLLNALLGYSPAVRDGALKGLRWLEQRSPGLLVHAVEGHPDPRIHSVSWRIHEPDAGDPPEGLPELFRWAEEARVWADRLEEALRGCGSARIAVRLALVHFGPPELTGRGSKTAWGACAAAPSSEDTTRLAARLSRDDVTREDVLLILNALARLAQGSQVAVRAVWPLLGSRDDTVRSLALQAVWAMGVRTPELDELTRALLTSTSSPQRLVALRPLKARGVDEAERFAGEVRGCIGDRALEVRRLAGLLVQWMDDLQCPPRSGQSVVDVPPLPSRTPSPTPLPPWPTPGFRPTDPKAPPVGLRRSATTALPQYRQRAGQSEGQSTRQPEPSPTPRP
jgi:hypothetical protein